MSGVVISMGTFDGGRVSLDLGEFWGGEGRSGEVGRVFFTSW